MRQKDSLAFKAKVALDSNGNPVVSYNDNTDNRILVVVEKVSPTPPKYPRRPGLFAKQPL